MSGPVSKDIWDIRDPWRKVMESNGLRFDFFCSKIVWNRRGKKSFLQIFYHLFTPLNGLFASVSQSPMSKLFKCSESLGKSNGKKWSQIWTFLLTNGVKLPRRNFFLNRFLSFLPFVLGAVHKLCQPKIGESSQCQHFPQPPLPPLSAMSAFAQTLLSFPHQFCEHI